MKQLNLITQIPDSFYGSTLLFSWTFFMLVSRNANSELESSMSIGTIEYLISAFF